MVGLAHRLTIQRKCKNGQMTRRHTDKAQGTIRGSRTHTRHTLRQQRETCERRPLVGGVLVGIGSGEIVREAFAAGYQLGALKVPVRRAGVLGCLRLIA